MLLTESLTFHENGYGLYPIGYVNGRQMIQWPGAVVAGLGIQECMLGWCVMRIVRRDRGANEEERQARNGE